MGLTVVLTVETPGDPGGTLSRYGVEEFVADNVVLLRNVREGTFRRRTLEVLKMRGAMHHKGDVGFTIVPGSGLVALPVTAPNPSANPGDERVSSGNPGLDRLTSGGLLRGSSTLLSGPTGTGKTLLATQFAADGAANGEGVLLVAYEETREQVHRNGAALGHDFAAYEQEGRLHVVSLYPEVASLDDHLVEVRALVERSAPGRLVIDSLSALERLGSPHAYREFVIGITSFAKTVGLASVMTASSPHLAGATSVTESHISGLIDSIVLLRHVEAAGRLERGIMVLKMRGSDHDRALHELSMRDGHLVVGEPFTGLRGLLAGQPLDDG
jgi:circadian clock protein KaiC